MGIVTILPETTKNPITLMGSQLEAERKVAKEKKEAKKNKKS